MTTFLKRTDINKEFTSLVSTFIKEGYTFSPTMSGHQGEEMKVDLDNGKETVRIRLEREHWYTIDDGFYAEGLELIVEVFDNVGKDSFNTLWSGKGKEIFRNTYYTINDRNSMFTTSKQFILDRCELHHKRYKSRTNTSTKYAYLDTNKAKAIVLPFVKRQPGCSRKTVNDIVEISRKQNSCGRYYSVVVNRGKNVETYYMTIKATV